MTGVRLPHGSCMSLENYCNIRLKGNHMRITSSIVTMDEEMMLHELGDRVANAVTEYACTGWDALLDAIYEEEMREAS